MTVQRRGARIRPALARRIRTLREAGEAGMATAEYAIVMVAAAALAGVLLVILRSPTVRGLLEGLITGALGID